MTGPFEKSAQFWLSMTKTFRPGQTPRGYSVLGQGWLFCEMLQFGWDIFPETLALASLCLKGFFVSFPASLGSFLVWKTEWLESKSEFLMNQVRTALMGAISGRQWIPESIQNFTLALTPPQLTILSDTPYPSLTSWETMKSLGLVSELQRLPGSLSQVLWIHSCQHRWVNWNKRVLISHFRPQIWQFPETKDEIGRRLQALQNPSGSVLPKGELARSSPTVYIQGNRASEGWDLPEVAKQVSSRAWSQRLERAEWFKFGWWRAMAGVQ